MRGARRWVALGVILGAGVLASVAIAASTPRVGRCAYTRSRYLGQLALYPWHMSCATARQTLIASESRHDKIIQFTADGAYTFDGGAVKIAGRWWVCGGRMGFYFCGYPYRPARAYGIGGGTTFKGPFTKEFIDEACADDASLCAPRVQTYQPPRAYR